MIKRLSIPRKLADRIEKLRHPGPDNEPSFREFTLALLNNTVAGYEETLNGMNWESNMKIVVDPTLSDGEVRIVASDGSTNKVVTLTPHGDNPDEMIATDQTTGLSFRVSYDPEDGNCRVEPCVDTQLTRTTTSSASKTSTQT